MSAVATSAARGSRRPCEATGDRGDALGAGRQFPRGRQSQLRADAGQQLEPAETLRRDAAETPSRQGQPSWKDDVLHAQYRPPDASPHTSACLIWADLERSPFSPLLRRAVLHRRPRHVPHGPARHPNRAHSTRSFHRRPAQEPRLRDGSVRKEPRRRPERDAADDEQARRVLRQPLSPRRRGGTRVARLSQGPEFRKEFGPRGVLRCKARDKDDATEDPRFGRVGKQTIEDTGAPTKKRMETIDDKSSAAAIDYIKRQQGAGTPFFCWFNPTRMHARTHVRPEHRGVYKHGDSEYIDGMIEHDATIGEVLRASMRWKSPTTPSWSTRPTTDRT